MGHDRAIRFPGGETPAWHAIHTQLLRVGEAAPLRMIDGQPAFPDETPDPGWSELRVGTATGMVTIRRGPGVLTCVVWGNADDTLTNAWHRVIWACGSAGGGKIDTPAGPLSPDEFAQSVGLRPA